MLKLLFICLTFSFSSLTFATQKVAKAIITRGNVKATLPDGSVIDIKKGTWLDEGSKVTTAPKSFVKFLFTDKSQMNLGPNSEMEIAKFDKKDAGIITLMKGSLRSKVTKNYIKDKGKKDKSKLFVKTKSAAMGVRGTDFLVTFNPRNKFTTLDVISGAVSMAPLKANEIAKTTARAFLETMVSSKKAVMVRKGETTNASQGMNKTPKPKKIPKLKFKKLLKKDIPIEASINPFVINGEVVNSMNDMAEVPLDDAQRDPTSIEDGGQTDGGGGSDDPNKPILDPNKPIVDPDIPEIICPGDPGCPEINVDQDFDNCPAGDPICQDTSNPEPEPELPPICPGDSRCPQINNTRSKTKFNLNVGD